MGGLRVEVLKREEVCLLRRTLPARTLNDWLIAVSWSG